MRLSPRQEQVVRLIARGRTDKEISSALGIAHGTVRLHVRLALARLNATNRAHAAYLWSNR